MPVQAAATLAGFRIAFRLLTILPWILDEMTILPQILHAERILGLEQPPRTMPRTKIDDTLPRTKIDDRYLKRSVAASQKYRTRNTPCG
jgi:hypothetical protein